MSPSDLQKRHLKAHDAQYALAVFRSVFASVENKGVLGYIPELVIRVRFPSSAPFFLPVKIARSFDGNGRGAMSY
jgi:hypothetical protein